VKSPDQSKTIGDVFTVIATVPAEEAFRPLADGHCAFVKS
jgi:branched-chain amino acid transport system substrate-binding protein